MAQSSVQTRWPFQVCNLVADERERFPDGRYFAQLVVAKVLRYHAG